MWVITLGIENTSKNKLKGKSCIFKEINLCRLLCIYLFIYGSYSKLWQKYVHMTNIPNTVPMA